MARKTQALSLTGSQAKYILERLIDQRKITAAEFRKQIDAMRDEVSAIEQRLVELRRITIPEPLRQPVRSVKRVAKKIAKKTRKLSAATRASYRLQGQYVGYMKQIPERERARFKRMAKQEGREKAVAEMKKRLGK